MFVTELVDLLLLPGSGDECQNVVLLPLPLPQECSISSGAETEKGTELPLASRLQPAATPLCGWGLELQHLQSCCSCRKLQDAPVQPFFGKKKVSILCVFVHVLCTVIPVWLLLLLSERTKRAPYPRLWCCSLRYALSVGSSPNPVLHLWCDVGLRDMHSVCFAALPASFCITCAVGFSPFIEDMHSFPLFLFWKTGICMFLFCLFLFCWHEIL